MHIAACVWKIFEGETLAVIKTIYCHPQKNSGVYTFSEKYFLLLGSANKHQEDVISKDLTYSINGLYIFNLSNHLKSKLEHQPYGCHAHAFMVLLKDNTAVTCILSVV